MFALFLITFTNKLPESKAEIREQCFPLRLKRNRFSNDHLSLHSCLEVMSNEESVTCGEIENYRIVTQERRLYWTDHGDIIKSKKKQEKQRNRQTN
jgi:hypothetical protein